ncbi:hypothetical protein, partial [Mitsuaria sp. GD03876]|uniref:hypothetical protein n=1 Tax=Mitsuaria sp. GD03876 TaxID=2975399 RepID=UPI00244AC040
MVQGEHGMTASGRPAARARRARTSRPWASWLLEALSLLVLLALLVAIAAPGTSRAEDGAPLRATAAAPPA